MRACSVRAGGGGAHGRRYDQIVRFPIVLFDLDGTLIDTGPIILASFRHATRTILGREIPDERLMAHVGGFGLRQQMRLLDEERADELVRCYREHNEPLHAEVRAFPGMAGVLAQLAAEGRRLGIVSTKRRTTIELAFEHVPIGGYFDVVVGSDDTERHKPHPDPLLYALSSLAASPREAAYVGDAPFDVEAAKAAGVFSVAVAWGGIHPRERLEAAAPDVLVSSPEELLGVL